MPVLAEPVQDAGGAGLPSGVYIDEYGNAVYGAANILAFPTDRAGELADIHVDSTATFVPPPAGVQVKGVQILGASVVDLSAVQSGHVKDCRFLGYTVTLGNDSGTTALLVSGVTAENEVQESNPFISVLSGGLYWGIRLHSGVLNVAAGLATTDIVVEDCDINGTVTISGDIEVSLVGFTIDLSHIATFSSSTSPSLISRVTTHGNATTIVNSSTGTGRLRIVGGDVANILRDGNGTGTIHLNPSGGLLAFATALGTYDKLVTVNGWGGVVLNACNSPLTLNNAGSQVDVNDAGAATANAAVIGVGGSGSLLVSGLGAVGTSVSDLHVGAGSNAVLDASGGAIGAARVVLDSGGALTVTATGDVSMSDVRVALQGALTVDGNSQVSASLVAIGTVATAGFDMTRVVVEGNITATLSGDNTDTYYGFGLDSLVD